MKAEERKALHTNTLAKQLSRAYEGMKQGASRSLFVYVGVVAAIVLAVVLFRWFSRSSDATTSQRWLLLDEIVFTEQLDSALEDASLKETPQGRILKFKDARVKLAEGLRDWAANPSEARKKVEQGTELYEGLIKSSGRVPLLHQEALWGAAQGNEALGDLAKAREHYEKLVKEYPVSALGKDAATQLKRLDSEAGQKEAHELSKAFAPPR